ncbi:carboxylic ester hydrolase [Cavenderia fasciculata]|uniref:Carboxylic ester hydrolase n=1 Tax=Cavenderia fasciculata TaxID=261658 RepID=F4QD21_CACFS|nr:carboxylic ester hydrolase [Cavenderia fasciculata]EGG13702.1 carboxylic ester hydrolase [Cavenderia fasciculata]|eukprot:XP_004350406.1 carboxylic ester hydrolase [Cavenderia fasciculata]
MFGSTLIFINILISIYLYNHIHLEFNKVHNLIQSSIVKRHRILTQNNDPVVDVDPAIAQALNNINITLATINNNLTTMNNNMAAMNDDISRLAIVTFSTNFNNNNSSFEHHQLSIHKIVQLIMFVIIRLFRTLWRWSQLYLTLLILLCEKVARGVISIVFSVIPFSSYIECVASVNRYSSKHIYTEAEKDLDRDAIELITSRGYPCEEHYVTTPDGFILGLHRITGPRINSPPQSPPASPRDNGPNGADLRVGKPAVLIMHGFMQTSEAWLCRANPEDSLPFILADAGFDVWLGNNRGNKYSFKHTTYTPSQERFWNWSLDELVRYDLPSIVDVYRTRLPTISYIGFSQGTAQGWAALSTNTALAAKINLFVALAPVSTVKGFSNPMIDSLARSRPDFIFLLFGKKAMLPSTVWWRQVLPKEFFVQLIDSSVRFLFGWKTHNLDEEEKKMLYSHIFSYTSVKSVVHWFQIIQTNRFQMFDDELLGITPNENSNKKHRYHGRVIPGYHPAQILTKCALFYGGQDTLPNTKALLAHLPKDKVVLIHEEESYEHLDFMWGKTAGKAVFSKIVTLLRASNKTIVESDDD